MKLRLQIARADPINVEKELRGLLVLMRDN